MKRRLALEAIATLAWLSLGRAHERTDEPGIAARTLEMQELGVGGEGAHVEKRQGTNTNTSGTDSTTSMATWEADVERRCSEALSQLNVASNPSGTAVCYNLPSLDTADGTFMADLRLYQVSAPSGEFAGVDQKGIAVVAQYSSASVSRSTRTASVQAAAAAARRGDSSQFRRRQQTQSQSPVLLQAYSLVGQIDPQRMSGSLDMGQVESWVTPAVVLSATNAAGAAVNVTVSSNEAAFVAGVFSDRVVLSPFALAQLAADQASAALRNGTAPFVLPGVDILVAPVGLAVTAAWALLGAAAYAFGTYERYMHRDMYRRRRARAGAQSRFP